MYLTARIEPWGALKIKDPHGNPVPLTGPGFGVAVAFESLEELREECGDDMPYLTFDTSTSVQGDDL